MGPNPLFTYTLDNQTEVNRLPRMQVSEDFGSLDGIVICPELVLKSALTIKKPPKKLDPAPLKFNGSIEAHIVC